jgi:hypothetical protein
MRHSKQLKTYCLITAALLSATLLNACGKPQHELAGKYQPVLNPHPHNFITVRGYISNKLSKQVQLIWHVSYYTNNSKCKKIINSFEGVTSPLSKIDSYTVITNKDHRYLIRIPIDRYQQGLCKWQASQLYYSFFYKKQNYGTPATAINLDKKSVIWYINKLTIQAIKEKNKQNINGPSLIEDNWACNKVCNLTTKAKKQQHYIYVVNFTKVTSHG